MTFFTLDKIKYTDKIKIQDIFIADVKDYDCYICAGYENDNDFTIEFNKLFNNDKSFNIFIFDKKTYKTVFANNVYFYNLEICFNKSKHTANLSYFNDNFKNIFLKMDIKGREIKWLYSIDMNFLFKFKQIVMFFYYDKLSENNLNEQICYDKLNYTHYIININKTDDYVQVVYLRKDIYDEYADSIYEKDLFGITIDNVADLI